MKHVNFLLLVTALLLGSTAYAQNYQKDYLNAKALFSSQDYSLAREAFRPLIKRNPENPFAAYASYYYGLSTYYAGHAEEARTIFLQARERFPNWSRVDDINYWIARLYFENSDHFLALNAISNMKNPQVKEDANAMMEHYLMQDASLTEMEAIYEKYRNPSTARVYAAKLAGQPMDAKQRKTLDALMSEYNLDEADFLVSVQSTRLKDTYKVAVLMPFLIENIRAEDKNRVNEFVLDLYNGIVLGMDSLRNNGVNIELFAYDTKRDTTATRRLTQLDELRGMDMIIGPLFPEPARIISEFGLQYGINVFNPLSSSPDNIEGNPHYFLINPSAVTIGEAMGDYAAALYTSKPGVVIFGDSDNDLKMARAYMARYQAANEQTLISRGISKDDSEEVLEFLLSSRSIKEAATEEGRENMRIGMDSVGHIFVASGNSLIYSKVLSAVETRGDDIQVIGAAEWLDMPVVKYETFERLKVKFYAPGYIDESKPAYKYFQREYMRKHRKSPSRYAEKGYEMAIFLGSSLARYGNYPQLAWISEGKLDGTLTEGYSYPNKQDNQVVPVLEFSEDGLELIVRENKPSDEKTAEQN